MPPNYNLFFCCNFYDDILYLLEKIVNSFTTEQISSLKQAAAIISISGNEYNYTEMASVFGTMNTNITSNETKLLYGLYNYQGISVNDTKSIKEINNF